MAAVVVVVVRRTFVRSFVRSFLCVVIVVVIVVVLYRRCHRRCHRRCSLSSLFFIFVVVRSSKRCRRRCCLSLSLIIAIVIILCAVTVKLLIPCLLTALSQDVSSSSSMSSASLPSLRCHCLFVGVVIVNNEVSVPRRRAKSTLGWIDVQSRIFKRVSSGLVANLLGIPRNVPSGWKTSRLSLTEPCNLHLLPVSDCLLAQAVVPFLPTPWL